MFMQGIFYTSRIYNNKIYFMYMHGHFNNNNILSNTVEPHKCDHLWEVGLNFEVVLFLKLLRTVHVGNICQQNGGPSAGFRFLP